MFLSFRSLASDTIISSFQFILLLGVPTVEDTEVHDAFNAGVTTMINTVGSSSTAFGSYNDHDPVYLGKYDIETPSINDIPVTVLWGTAHESGASTLQSGNEYNGCPQKFKVPIGTPWVQERFGMIMGYPAFADWVKNENAEWLNPSEESKQRQPLYLYEQSWPNVLDATAYEERETITEAQLGEPGARTKSNGSSKTSNSSFTIWEGNGNEYYQEGTASGLANYLKCDGTDILRFNGTAKDNYTIEIHTNTGWYSIGTKMTQSNYPWTGDHIDLVITESDAIKLREANDIKFQVNNATLSSVVLNP